MTTVARLHPERSAPSVPERYLGPGQVTALEPEGVVVRLRTGEEVPARLAMPIPYAPELDDSLLVIGEPNGHYVIGVLHGTGRVSLALPGNVELRACGGELSLRGDTGVRLDGPDVVLRAERLRLVATAVVETYQRAVRKVRELASEHLGRSHTIVVEDATLQAKGATFLTEETMKINGRQIHLG